MNEKNSTRLENQLCFTIYAASREMTKLYRPFLEELGLTYPQYLAMLVLWEDEQVTVKKLGEKLFLDSGTLTPMLKRMEAHSLVTRHRDKEDERKVVITLTVEGKQLEKKAQCIPEQLLMATHVSQLDVESLLNQLKILLNEVHTQNEKTSQK
ncbi:MarR family winged helix-turn-helix transcriptional regulator [Bacillus sp. 2205SS5-2]|uniref:MarR family winged helix-turn-helix transcriptional regulator n=1 Tax=Bacillus sp. 2205SS5-2 TaxID=3109031 RepID=UPI0030044EF6